MVVAYSVKVAAAIETSMPLLIDGVYATVVKVLNDINIAVIPIYFSVLLYDLSHNCQYTTTVKNYGFKIIVQFIVLLSL